MVDSGISHLETLISIWTVAESIGRYLPAGDLISLSRSSTTLRAGLHGFENADLSDQTNNGHARESLHIGRHNTDQWRLLKSIAAWECSIQTHTKGDKPKPCRYCSRPVCGACIVKSSFSRGHENTFQNRIRHLCTECWDTGNPSRGHRFPLATSPTSSTDATAATKATRPWYDATESTRDYCICTLKSDGHICPECKDFQNWEAIAHADAECHGVGCKNPLGDDKERRRICLWCDKSLPRQIGGTTRYHWNQKMVEARARAVASRQADIEEYNRRRLKLMRMSRREFRGDLAVKGDKDADVPQYLRHLDTMNYRTYMSDTAAPTPEAVYDSKRGFWHYNREFLLKIGTYCRKSDKSPTWVTTDLACLKGHSTYQFARTNAEKADEVESETIRRLGPGKYRWTDMKAIILEHVLVNKTSYEDLCDVLAKDYDVSASANDYRSMVDRWIWLTTNRSSIAKGDRETRHAGIESYHHASRAQVAAPEVDDQNLNPQVDGDDDDRDDGSGDSITISPAPSVFPDDGDIPTMSSSNILLPAGLTDSDDPTLSITSSTADPRGQLPHQPSSPLLTHFSGPRSSTSQGLASVSESHGQPAQAGFIPVLRDEGVQRHESQEDVSDDPPPYSPNGWLWP